VRFLREVQKCPSPRDRAIALVPFYAGTRIAEITGLDVDDVRLSARKGILRILGKGEKIREIPIHPDLRSALTDWIDERADWPGANTPALFLNQRGARLTVRGAHDIITTIATTAGLEDDDITAHILRHTFATRLVRGRTDLVIVAELLGHARLETTRAYSRPPNKTRSTRSSSSTPTTEPAGTDSTAGEALRCGSALQGPQRGLQTGSSRAAGVLAVQAYLGCTP